jgi:3-oxoacyl-[acyl-carrier-protein] synthase-3
VTALEAVAVHLPPAATPIEQVGSRLGLTARQTLLFRRFHGLDQVRLDPDGTVADLLAAAVRALPQAADRAADVRYVLYATSMPVQVPFPVNPLQDLCREFGFDNALAFKVGHHACASGLLALDVAGRLLDAGAHADPDALALVLTGEKTFTRDARIAPETSLFSECAAACLVRAGGGRDRVLSYKASLHGEYDGRLAANPQLLAEYNRAYPELLEGAIRDALDAAGTALEEIRLILPHNANQISWRTLSRRLGIGLDRILIENVPRLGHSFAADGFINLRTALDRGLLAPGDRYLMAGAGIGAAFSAMVFEH